MGQAINENKLNLGREKVVDTKPLSRRYVYENSRKEPAGDPEVLETKGSRGEGDDSRKREEQCPKLASVSPLAARVEPSLTQDVQLCDLGQVPLLFRASKSSLVKWNNQRD